MDMWSIEDVEVWLVHTRQHDPTHPTKVFVSPILGFDGKELLSFFDDDDAETRSAYFSACEPFRLLMLQRKVASDRGKVALYWDRSVGHSVRSLSFSYGSPIMRSPSEPGASLSSTPSSTTVESDEELRCNARVLNARILAYFIVFVSKRHHALHRAK
jgi:hypothetical protein